MPPEGPKDEDAEDLAATVAVSAKGESDDLAATLVQQPKAPPPNLAARMEVSGATRSPEKPSPLANVMLIGGKPLSTELNAAHLAKSAPPQRPFLTPKRITIAVGLALAAVGIGAAIGFAERDSSSGSAQPAPTQTISH